MFDGTPWPCGPCEEFLDQLGIFECELFGFASPTLTGEEIFAHRNLLNVDSDPLCFGLVLGGKMGPADRRAILKVLQKWV